jgi:hypothetical protein
MNEKKEHSPDDNNLGTTHTIEANNEMEIAF